ncbi:hypothetical protein HRbin15_02030 [bacterium HR15]|nr:hypothetical protein HRbin15_02030 [bacterium HR15]
MIPHCALRMQGGLQAFANSGAWNAASTHACSPLLTIPHPEWGTIIGMQVRRWMHGLLVLIALLNSGGIGYWSCCGQICSASFWLPVCIDNCPPSTTAFNLSRDHSHPIFAFLPCECQFVSVEVLPPLAWKPVIVVQLGEAPSLLDVQTIDDSLTRGAASPLTTPIFSQPLLWHKPHGRRAPPSV